MQNKAEKEYASPLVLVLFTACLPNKNMEHQVFRDCFPEVCLCCLLSPDSERNAIHEFQHILEAKADFVIS